MVTKDGPIHTVTDSCISSEDKLNLRGFQNKLIDENKFESIA